MCRIEFFHLICSKCTQTYAYHGVYCVSTMLMLCIFQIQAQKFVRISILQLCCLSASLSQWTISYREQRQTHQQSFKTKTFIWDFFYGNQSKNKCNKEINKKNGWRHLRCKECCGCETRQNLMQTIKICIGRMRGSKRIIKRTST